MYGISSTSMVTLPLSVFCCHLSSVTFCCRAVHLATHPPNIHKNYSPKTGCAARKQWIQTVSCCRMWETELYTIAKKRERGKNEQRLVFDYTVTGYSWPGYQATVSQVPGVLGAIIIAKITSAAFPSSDMTPGRIISPPTVTVKWPLQVYLGRLHPREWSACLKGWLWFPCWFSWGRIFD